MHFAFFYPSIGLGGQQTQILQISEQLYKLGHTVSWLYIYDSELKLKASEYGNTKKLILPRFNNSSFGLGRIINRWVYYNFGAFQLKKYCKRNKVDVVLSSTTNDSILINKLSKNNSVIHFRMMGGSMRQVEPHWLEKYERLAIDRYINGYFGWPAGFKELDYAKVPSRKHIEMNFAVNTEIFYPINPLKIVEIKHKLGITSNEFIIGWVGRIALNMQVWDTLRLGVELKKNNVNNFKLLIVGGGSDIKLLNEKIKEYDLESNSIVTGWVHFSEVNEYINVMDFVPLLEEDPHGGSIIREAMACGKVAISVDGASGTQAWFMKKGASVLVQPENYIEEAAKKIIELVKDGNYHTIGAEARKYAIENLSFKKQAETIINASKKSYA